MEKLPAVKIQINQKINKRLGTAPKDYEALLTTVKSLIQKTALIRSSRPSASSFRAQSAHENAIEDAYIVTYIDPEGDETMIENQEDYDQAIELARDTSLLKVFVKTNEQEELFNHAVEENQDFSLRHHLNEKEGLMGMRDEVSDTVSSVKDGFGNNYTNLKERQDSFSIISTSDLAAKEEIMKVLEEKVQEAIREQQKFTLEQERLAREEEERKIAEARALKAIEEEQQRLTKLIEEKTIQIELQEREKSDLLQKEVEPISTQATEVTQVIEKGKRESGKGKRKCWKKNLKDELKTVKADMKEKFKDDLKQYKEEIKRFKEEKRRIKCEAIRKMREEKRKRREEALKGIDEVMPEAVKDLNEEATNKKQGRRCRESGEKSIKCMRKHKAKKELKKCIRHLVVESLEKMVPKVYEELKQQNLDLPIHSKFVCDGCDNSPIIGTRYKCTVCEDFDFCEECESTKEHDHPFLKIKTPSQAPISITAQIIMVGNDEEEKKVEDQNERPRQPCGPGFGHGFRHGGCGRFKHGFGHGKMGGFPHMFEKIGKGIKTFIRNFAGLDDKDLSENIPPFRRKMAVVIKSPEERVVSSPGLIVFKTWRLKNLTNRTWPKEVTLNKLFGDLEIETMRITRALGSGEEYDLSIPITVPATAGEYFATLGLFGPKGGPIGEELAVCIQVTDDKDEEKQLAELQKAINLCDRGYGTFEACLEVLRQAGGDESKAVDLLSVEMEKNAI